MNHLDVENVKTLGGLKEEEIKALNRISQRNEILTRYGLAKLLKIDKKKAYRIVLKLMNFGYVKLAENKTISITEIGKMFVLK